jgi:hypothetical protein
MLLVPPSLGDAGRDAHDSTVAVYEMLEAAGKHA